MENNLSNPSVLRPLDVAVAIRLAQTPGATFEALGRDLFMSTSTAHEAVKRLEAAQLVVRGSRRVNRLALREFLEHGVRYAFPATVAAQVQGVPTAHSGPPLAAQIVAVDPVVWPAAHGPVRGAGVTPLLARAAELPEHCPELYEALTLVDALRVGRARERTLASAALRERLRPPAAVA
jgi:hypothetical protein